MIYVRVELWPGGRKESREILGEAFIVNDGTTSGKSGGQLGRYHAMLSKRGGFKRGTPQEPVADVSLWKNGIVGPFKRKQGGGWDLLRLVLDTLLEGRDFRGKDGEPVKELPHAVKVSRHLRRSIPGYRCAACHRPVYQSPGGAVCAEGHGGCEEPIPEAER